MTTSNDNYPSTNPNGDWWPDQAFGQPVCITEIATDMTPTVSRNVAAYYRGKGERWADVMASKIESATNRAANDNARQRRQRAG